MKAIYERLRAVGNFNSDDFPKILSFMLMAFFLIFGSLSLFILLQSPV